MSQLDLKLDRPPLRYHGGKWAAAEWIASFFPEHGLYCEPFGGGAGVLLRKARSRVEIYNELDSEVVNLFRILRDRSKAKRLVELLWLTPFSRVEFEEAHENAQDEMERARRLVYRSFAGFGSTAFNADNRDGFRWMPAKPYAREWSGLPQNLQAITARLRGVVIENRNAFEIIPRYDREDALFYVDPPYPSSTRNNSGKGYRFEFSDHEHRQLAFLLRRLKGKVLVSGYGCDLYERELFADWHVERRCVIASGQKHGVPRTEVLWMNFVPKGEGNGSVAQIHAPRGKGCSKRAADRDCVAGEGRIAE